jgi:hypothetical protein
MVGAVNARRRVTAPPRGRCGARRKGRSDFGCRVDALGRHILDDADEVRMRWNLQVKRA